MGMTADAWREALSAMLPRGRVWNLDPDSNLQRLLAGWGLTFSRVEARAEQLLEEMDPRTTYEMLADYERALKLPDLCTGELLSLDARRAAVVERLLAKASQKPERYVQLAEALGFVGAWVEEFEQAHCESDCEAYLNEPPWSSTFMLHLPAADIELGATCESDCEDFLGEVMQSAIECLVSRIRPAHLAVVFSYGE